MKTSYKDVQLKQPDASHPIIQKAAQVLRQGGVVAIPTETVYGLAADATSTEAVRRIFEAKGRPADNPLIVHIANRSQLDGWIGKLDQQTEALMDRFWPGPLTLVLPLKGERISPLVSAGLSSVAVRMPAHPVALSVIQACGKPLAAPSANLSGRPSPTCATHVKQDLDGRIDLLVDGGSCEVGLESTVLACTSDKIELLRPGAVTLDELNEAGFEVQTDNEITEAHEQQSEGPRSPGMKYKHYAPAGDLVLVVSKQFENTKAWIETKLSAAAKQGLRCGVLTYSERVYNYDTDLVLTLGSIHEPQAWARRLYDSLRAFDQAGIEKIYVEACPAQGVGYAVLNRLYKAAQNNIVLL